MSTVEAMTNGCVPLVFRCGGQPEIVENGVSGCLWDTTEELAKLTLHFAQNSAERNAMAKEAHRRSQLFSRDEFRRRTKQVLRTAFQGAPATEKQDAP